MIVTFKNEFTKHKQVASNEGNNSKGLQIHIVNIKGGFSGIHQHINMETIREELNECHIRCDRRKIRGKSRRC
jgi:hypothetical protein